MRHPFAPFPAPAPLRALSDGTSGSIGADIVGPHELRDGAVGLNHLGSLPAETLMGNAGTGAATPTALDPTTAYNLLATAAPELVLLKFDDAATLVAPSTAKTLRILGRNASGDGGEAYYFRAGPTQPAHPGWVQTADGDYWVIDGEEIRPESFGAIIGDGVQDERQELQDAIDTAVALQRPLVLEKMHAVYGQLTVDDRIVMRGSGPSGGIVFYNRWNMVVKKGDGIADQNTIADCVFENLTFKDPNAEASWQTLPMLEGWRASGWRVVDCTFEGSYKRDYGLWIGRGFTAWGCAIDSNRFRGCKIGVVVGDVGDATHNRFTSNTVDNNEICGAVFCNPTGGTILSNSFEYNNGLTALAILSEARGSAVKASNIQIRGNYIYNNTGENANPQVLNRAGNPLSTGVLVGHDVPGASGFTSGTGVWAAEIVGNYIVSDRHVWPIRANILNGGRVMHNVVSGYLPAETEHDIELSGNAYLVDVFGNKNQSLNAFDRVSAAEAWRTPLAALGDDLRVEGEVGSRGGRFAFRSLSSQADGRGGLTYAEAVAGSAGAAAPVFDLGAVAGADSAFLMVSVERTAGGGKASFVLHVADTMSGAVTPVSSSGTLDGAVFAIAGGALTLTRGADWRGNVTAMFAGAPSA